MLRVLNGLCLFGRKRGGRLGVLLAVLFALVTLASSHGQGEGGNPLVGTWHQAMPAQAGGVIHNFMRFGADGSFFSTSLNEGGGLNVNGMRTQMWGRYSIKPAGNGLYDVTITYQGHAPLQLCMQGYGCRPMSGPAGQDRGMFQFQGDMLQSSNGFAAQRSGIPPVLAQRLPATWMLQPPPPINMPSGGGTAGGGGYVSPRNNIPGLGGNCDDLQQSRICTMNDGWYHKDPRTGCMVCSK
jgi:hypothetical protein